MEDTIGDVAQRPSGPFEATLECGSYRWRTEVDGIGERDVTRGAFLALAALVDDPETDPDLLGEFLTVEVVETSQLWIYPTDAFLANLVLRPGDQRKARRALERLAPQDPAGDTSGD